MALGAYRCPCCRASMLPGVGWIAASKPVGRFINRDYSGAAPREPYGFVGR
jgi:hypothetical protein